MSKYNRNRKRRKTKKLPGNAPKKKDADNPKTHPRLPIPPPPPFITKLLLFLNSSFSTYPNPQQH
jgi:hypothetical protein